MRERSRRTSDGAVARAATSSDVPEIVRQIGTRRGAEEAPVTRSTLVGVSDTGTVWTEGLEPGRQAVALGIAAVLTIVVIDVLLVGELSFFFDLCFIVLCLGLALVVRPHDFFIIGVLPPLMMLAVVAMLGAVAPETVADRGDGIVQAVVSGLAHHSGALVAGYAVCPGTLWLRQRTLQRNASG
ncbi:DUF6542 domain-containing protein [Nocardioides sp. B-3]|uniref:DUF6542 domain-containing protein n=1 Tax=Nocardioides sp. B-3 TaxID=2895565 RepID=UPI0021521FAC|nr:DUF6542 domain-containing protein [Nocardioides sp. B-3]UUZ60230.1 hypothetical protein LP418_04645 [Nocardioides sp. B-3]